MHSPNTFGALLFSAAPTHTISRSRIIGNFIENKANGPNPGVAHCIVAINELQVRGKIDTLLVEGNHCLDIDGTGIYVSTEADEPIIANNLLEERGPERHRRIPHRRVN